MLVLEGPASEALPRPCPRFLPPASTLLIGTPAPGLFSCSKAFNCANPALVYSGFLRGLYLCFEGSFAITNGLHVPCHLYSLLLTKVILSIDKKTRKV